ncbi:MAG: hypothetical protein ACPG77_00455 [Nannocystaceae bacterium]
MQPLVWPDEPDAPPPGVLDPAPVRDPDRAPERPEPDDDTANPALTAVPGYQRAKNADVTTHMVQAAIDVLARSKAAARARGWTEHCPPTGPTPCGVVEYFIDPATGRRYAVLVEEHFHQPGGPVKPWGKHPGASVFTEPRPSTL